MASVSSLRDFDYEGLFSDDARWCAKEKYRYVELTNYLVGRPFLDMRWAEYRDCVLLVGGTAL